MTGFFRMSALLAIMAVLAFSGIAASAGADGVGHHEHWTAKQCTNHAKQWKKAHKNATATQTKQENKLLKKHDCKETV